MAFHLANPITVMINQTTFMKAFKKEIEDKRERTPNLWVSKKFACLEAPIIYPLS